MRSPIGSIASFDMVCVGPTLQPIARTAEGEGDNVISKTQRAVLDREEISDTMFRPRQNERKGRPCRPGGGRIPDLGDEQAASR